MIRNSSRQMVSLVGGYGAVGRALAWQLSNDGQTQISIVGRSVEKAKLFAQTLTGDVISAALDTMQRSSYSALPIETRFVFLMAPDLTGDFTVYCLERGINLIWMTTDVPSDNLDRINSAAKIGNAILLRQSGLAPGLTTLIATKILSDNPKARELHIGVLLGMGDHHGKDAVSWMMTPQKIASQPRPASLKRQINLDGNTPLRAFSFPFPDPYVERVKKTGPVATTHWLTLSPNWIARLLAIVISSGLLKFRLPRAVIAFLSLHLKIGDAKCGAWASVSMPDGTITTLSIVSVGQSEITAAMGVHGFLRLRNGPFNLGVFDIREITTLDQALEHLKTNVPINFRSYFEPLETSTMPTELL